MTARDPLLQAFDALRRAHGAREIAVARGRAWRVADLATAADELAARLAAEGFGAGDLVGLAAAPGPAFAAGLLALRRRGAVPLLCDSARPTADRLSALDQLGAVGFLAEATGWPERAGGWDLDRRTPTAPRHGDPVWGAVKLTSGSTGEPRGIATPSAALLADEAQLAATMGLAGDDRALAAVPLAHSYGFSSLVLPALVRGLCLVFPADRAPLAPLAAAAEHGATFFPTVPAWLGAYVRLAAPPPLAASVRLVVAAGAPLAADVAAAFRRRTGRPVHVFYGASESGGITYDRRGDAAERGTVGTAVDGVELTLDAASGRLAVRSPAVAEGYLPHGSPELAGGRFLAGDLAVFAADEVRLLGRADDWVLVRGKNVNPREVEAALRELAGVADVAVFGADGPDGPCSVLRAVVAAPDGGIDYARVAAHCRARLAEHKVPRSVVVVAELPRTERGKLDRAALVALAAG
ncbi:MAG: fatty acid--CoA ligase family protein [Thermoanaerobaculia bacterium]|nr:fatty acid--CoA ligase family protein [Thermoanaerobaculia bacterium]